MIAAERPDDRPVTAETLSLRAKVAYLARPGAYCEGTTAVTAVETHMSWVFLTDRHAYKLKKPVRHPFLDFSTLALRKADCEEEVRLNRRLAPRIYLGVVALAVGPSGELALGGGGEPCEWLVRMLRLPRERMLDAAIARDEVASDDVARVAQVLAAFYHRCEPVPMPLEDYLARLQQEVDLCRSELDAVDSDLDHAMVRRTADRLRGFLGRGARLLHARLQAGRMVEGHGDLRPEHICLLPVPVVIDCLEFNRDLRLLDVADELSHLEIECARIGGRSVGRSLFAQVSGDLADAVPPGLKAFYCGYRAFTRARLAAWHNIDAPAADPTRWTRRAREYLALAEDYAGAG